MKRTLLASAISALFSVPVVALAQTAAPAAVVPTLDKVLEASGLTMSGYIDSAYSHSNRNIESPNVSTRVFDTQNNSFVLHQVGLTMAKQPKEGFGGLVNVTGGKDAEVIHSTGAANSQVDVTQAYGQYASGPLTVIAGKYVTMHGTEVIASTGNTNFSRSILFGAVPFTHTGLRATYALSDSASLMAGVNNGWDQLTDQNKGKTIELGATVTPIKPLTIVASAMSGKETLGAGVEGTRTSGNIVASYAINDPLSVGVEYLTVTQKNTPVGDAKYNGVAGYLTYMMTAKWRGVLRLESFNDKDGFHFGTPSTKYKEGTLTVSYLPSSSFEVRGEVRRDTADNEVFTDYDGSMKKSLMTYAVQALYKF